MFKVRLFIILFGVGISFAVVAQEGEYRIKVLARAGEQNIKLRWAPNNAVAWERLNKYGYYVERVTISRNNKLITPPEKKRLTAQPVKPKPLNEWEGLADANDYAAVAAQALYGETFELSENYSSDIIQVVQKSKELEQRFSFALFAADQSFEVADMSGLAFIDHTAKADEKYLYRIISAVPKDIEAIDSAFVYVGLSDYKQLPPIYDVQAIFGDRSVIISWERENFEGIYNSFIVEKSVDSNKTFTAITEEPIINASPDERLNTRRAYKLDSLNENGKTVSYRVRGINAFGEVSPPSDTVSGYGFISLSTAPNIIHWGTDNQTASIKWEYVNRKEIIGFTVERSRTANGPFNEIAKLGPEGSSFNDEQPMATNYYRVKAFNKSNAVVSFPVLVQLEDSIPPVQPTGLEGAIDSVGIVKLKWIPNGEQDLIGYRVYRSNFKNAEFTQVTSTAIPINEWSDSLRLDNLTSKIYYKVIAVDQRYNSSEASEIVQLTKPDVLPPVPPVITQVKSEQNGVTIKWARSSSEDVISHHIYRRQGNSGDWILIRSFNDSTNAFTDNTLQLKTAYQYTIIAIDDSHLESKPAKPVLGKLLDTGVREKISGLKAEVDRAGKKIVLVWKNEEKDLAKYVIYRSKFDEPMSLYKTLGPGSVRFVDDGISVNSSYSYRVKAVYMDGEESLFSDAVVVNYK